MKDLNQQTAPELAVTCRERARTLASIAETYAAFPASDEPLEHAMRELSSAVARLRRMRHTETA